MFNILRMLSIFWKNDVNIISYMFINFRLIELQILCDTYTLETTKALQQIK